jgi:hypothetical protein
VKPIKIEPKNAQKIEAELLAVNGKSEAHTMTLFSEVSEVSELFVNDLGRLGLPKSQQAGAIIYFESGGVVPNSYKYSRTATRIELSVKKSGVFLCSIEKRTIYQGGGGFSKPSITEDQEKYILEKLKSKFSVIRVSNECKV